MSNQQEGNYADREPLSKRQKRGDGDEKQKADEIIAFGGPMYDEATARKILKELPAGRLEVGSEAVIGFWYMHESLLVARVNSRARNSY